MEDPDRGLARAALVRPAGRRRAASPRRSCRTGLRRVRRAAHRRWPQPGRVPGDLRRTSRARLRAGFRAGNGRAPDRPSCIASSVCSKEFPWIRAVPASLSRAVAVLVLGAAVFCLPAIGFDAARRAGCSRRRARGQAGPSSHSSVSVHSDDDGSDNDDRQPQRRQPQVQRQGRRQDRLHRRRHRYRQHRAAPARQRSRRPSAA